MADESLKTASIRARLAAILIDLLILSPLPAISLYIHAYDQWSFLIWAVFEQAIYTIFYVYLVSRYGGTPGKRWINLRIVNVKNKPIDLAHAFMRYLFLFIASVGVILIEYLERCSISHESFEKLLWYERILNENMRSPEIGNELLLVSFLVVLADNMLMIFNSQRRTLHDYLAKTRVVYHFPWSPSETASNTISAEAHS